MKKNNIKLLITLFAGTTAGLTLGYMTAPRSGDRTRKRILRELNSKKNEIDKAISEKIEDYTDQLNEIIEEQKYIGKKSIDGVRKKISAS